MIALLRGQLAYAEPGRAIIDVGGVGYEVLAPNRAIEAWSRSREAVVAHVSTQVREDAITLYGFETAADRAAFLVLISVSGIGPKLGLSCLETLGADALAVAIEREDVARIATSPGVGKKTAQRLVLELKGKLTPTFTPQGARPTAAPVEDLLSAALARLGYSTPEIARARDRLAADGVPPEAPVADRLRAALRVLARSEA